MTQALPQNWTLPRTADDILVRSLLGRDAEIVRAVKALQTKTIGTVNVKEFGAVGDGVTDDTAAITAADTAACAGTLGLDSATIMAESAVYFPAGIYKHTALTFRGAPWIGEGINATILRCYGSSGPAIDAVGSSTDRKLLNISNMTFDGNYATSTLYGLRLGHNYRSAAGLRSVRITGFPGPGIIFVADSWIQSFYDVYISFCGADSIGAGISLDPAITALNAFDWYNLWLENNGYAASGVAGGIELLDPGIINWKFYGGMWEGNYGTAEARFKDSKGIYLYGTYLECEEGKVTDGIVFDGSTIAGCYGMLHDATSPKTGRAIVASDTAKLTVDQVYFSANWPTHIDVNDDAIVSLIGEGVSLNTVSVASGAQFHRLTQKRVQLTDAATIAVNTTLGNSFYVTLTAARQMGSPSLPSLGQQITFTIYQDGTGGHALTWAGTYNVTWSDAGNAANKRSCIAFEFDGTFWNQIAAQSPYV